MKIFLWLLLLAVFGGCCFWHFRENRQFVQKIEKIPGNEAGWLMRFAWMRTVQFLAALAVCMLIISIYDWQLHNARTSIEEANMSFAELQSKIAEKPVPPAVAPQPQVQSSSTVPPPVANVTPQTNPPAPVTNETSLSAIYNPEESASGNSSTIDRLKKRYEDVLVTYLFLRKCNRVNEADYYIIMSALSQEMASINAPGRLQNDILTAAQGSYKEIYARSSCEGPSLDPLQTQYNDYVRTIAQYAPR